MCIATELESNNPCTIHSDFGSLCSPAHPSVKSFIMSSDAPPPPPPARRGPKANVVRKSKEERDAIERQAEHERRDRAAASKANEELLEKRRLQKYGITQHAPRPDQPVTYQGNPVTYRMGRGGRGGFMGSKPSTRTKSDEKRPTAASSSTNTKEEGAAKRKSSVSVAEVVSAATSAVAEPKPTTSQPTTPSSGKKSTSKPSTARKKKVKDEPETEYKGAGIEKRQTTPDFLYITDDSDGKEGHDVDNVIEISDDDDDAIQEERRRLYVAPHRLQRQQHKDREADINDEASSVIAQPGLRRPREGSSPSATRRKGKERVTVKPDPEAMQGVEIAEPVTAEGFEVESGALEQPVEATIATEEADDEDESKAAVAAKIRRKRPQRIPTFSTLEEREEYEREQQALRSIVREFGQVDIDDESDAQGAMSGEEGAAHKPRKAGKLDNATYLFQFPPILPDLYHPARNVKPDPEAEEQAANALQDGDTQMKDDVTEGKAIKDEKPIKIEDDEATRPPQPSAGKSRKAWLEPGKVGKLRVHASGKMTLDWGGTSLAAGAGIDAHFLQTVMLMQLDQDENIHGGQSGNKPEDGGAGQAANEDGKPRKSSVAQSSKKKEWNGDVTSFGQVRGKILVTPDWQEIL